MDKAELRATMRMALRAVTREEKASAALAALDSLAASRLWTEASIILLYDAMDEEAPTAPFLARALAAGKRCYFPRVEGGRLRFRLYAEGRWEPTRFGYREPDASRPALEPADGIVLALIPGLAFGARGERLGRGKGYYDAFLRSAGDAVVRVGYCLEAQVVGEVPLADSDEPVGWLLTERGLRPAATRAD